MNKEIEISSKNQIIIIWGVTAVATVSVISGMKVGIRRLSELCFGVGKNLFHYSSFIYRNGSSGGHPHPNDNISQHLLFKNRHSIGNPCIFGWF